jgi:hypothetical protein
MLDTRLRFYGVSPLANGLQVMDVFTSCALRKVHMSRPVVRAASVEGQWSATQWSLPPKLGDDAGNRAEAVVPPLLACQVVAVDGRVRGLALPRWATAGVAPAVTSGKAARPTGSTSKWASESGWAWVMNTVVSRLPPALT